MQFGAKAKYIRYSPYKLRSLVDVLRGKNAQQALNWLSSFSSQRVRPIKKVIESAVANAKNLNNIEAQDLFIKLIFVDQGPVFRFFDPGAMGRANPRKKRLSHISVTLEKIQEV